MAVVVHSREADSKGYITLLLDGPVGQTQAGEYVRADTPDGQVEILLHGQERFDVPVKTSKVTFADGSTWKPA